MDDLNQLPYLPQTMAILIQQHSLGLAWIVADLRVRFATQNLADLLDLSGIRGHPGIVMAREEAEFNVLPQQSPEHLLQAEHEPVERDRPRLQHLAAAEGEQLARERLGPRGGAADLDEIGAERIALEVVSVGDEYECLVLFILPFEDVHRLFYRGGDICPASGNRLDTEVVERQKKAVIVDSQRALQEGRSRERDEAYPVIFTYSDELLYDIFDDIETIHPVRAYFEIFGKHACRSIEVEHNIDSLRNRFRSLEDGLRPGQRQYK